MSQAIRFDILRRLAALSLVGALLSSANVVAGADYLEPEQAFRAGASAPAGDAITVRFEIAPGYHLYRDRIDVEVETGRGTLGPVDLPPGLTEYDATFGRNVEVLRGSAIVRIAMRDAAGDIRLRVSYQGCADRGLCYSPQTGILTATASAGRLDRVAWLGDPSPVLAAPAPAPAAAGAGASGRVESALASGSLVTVVGVFLVAGLLLSMTPCVLPMVPILSSIIVGRAARASRLRGFALALAYALGMALVYTVFGVVAGLLGEGLAAAMQNAWVLGTFAALLAALSLSMFGVVELQMPSAIQTRITAWTHRLPGGRLAGVFAMGGLSALVVGPCVAAPLAGALVFIGRTHDVVIGGVALFSLAMGMSVPLLLVGVSAGALLPRAGAWMEGMKRFFGVLLLAVALWIVSPLLPSSVLMLVLGGMLLVGAVCLGLLDPVGVDRSGAIRMARGLGLLVAVLGTFEIAGALAGGGDPAQPLRHWAGAARGEPEAPRKLAFRSVRSSVELDAVVRGAAAPVMLDVYADWCASCKEMERMTFEDPTIRPRLERAQLVRIDVTANLPDDRALLKRFGLFGPPGVLFLRADGSERTESRLVGYVPAREFAASLTAAGL